MMDVLWLIPIAFAAMGLVGRIAARLWQNHVRKHRLDDMVDCSYFWFCIDWEDKNSSIWSHSNGLFDEARKYAYRPQYHADDLVDAMASSPASIVRVPVQGSIVKGEMIADKDGTLQKWDGAGHLVGIAMVRTPIPTTQCFHFDPEQYRRDEMARRYGQLLEQQGLGLLTPNEVRERLGYEHLDGPRAPYSRDDEPACPWCHEVPASTPHICQSKPVDVPFDPVAEVDAMFGAWKDNDKRRKLR